MTRLDEKPSCVSEDVVVNVRVFHNGMLVVPFTVEDEDDVDTELAQILGIALPTASSSKKGRVQRIEWDAELEEMSREKAAAEATRGKVAEVEGEVIGVLTVILPQTSRLASVLKLQSSEVALHLVAPQRRRVADTKASLIRGIAYA